MAKEYSKSFYKSSTWRNCRESYLRSKGYICERCGGLATIVHHKTYISPNNINNPEITTNFNNLEALCQECHNNEHGCFKNKSRYIISPEGKVILR